jgi:hypothetical protein
MLRSPLCRHCHLPVKAGEFFRIAGYTVWVHPGCLLKRADYLDRHPERVSPLIRNLAQAMLLGQTRRQPSRSRPSQKPHLRVIK